MGRNSMPRVFATLAAIFATASLLAVAGVSSARAAAGTAASVTIDDDPLAVLSTSNAVVPEGNAGQTTMASVDVALTGLTEKTVHVNYATGDSTAAAPDDYLATSGTLTFGPGQTVQSVQVPVVGDD